MWHLTGFRVFINILRKSLMEKCNKTTLWKEKALFPELPPQQCHMFFTVEVGILLICFACLNSHLHDPKITQTAWDEKKEGIDHNEQILHGKQSLRRQASKRGLKKDEMWNNFHLGNVMKNLEATATAHYSCKPAKITSIPSLCFQCPWPPAGFSLGYLAIGFGSPAPHTTTLCLTEERYRPF